MKDKHLNEKSYHIQTNRMGAYRLSDAPGFYQPVRTNNFVFLLDVGPSSPLNHLKRAGTVDSPKNYFDLDKDEVQEVIEFSVVKFDAPHFSQSEIPIKRANSTIYFASVPEFKEGNLVINDYMAADGKSILMAWQALSYDILNDCIPTSDQYKCHAQVFEYMTDGTLVRSWDLYGCWVKSLSEESWDAENANKKTVTASIRFDKAIPKYEFNEEKIDDVRDNKSTTTGGGSGRSTMMTR